MGPAQCPQTYAAASSTRRPARYPAPAATSVPSSERALIPKRLAPAVKMNRAVFCLTIGTTAQQTMQNPWGIDVPSSARSLSPGLTQNQHKCVTNESVPENLAPPSRTADLRDDSISADAIQNTVVDDESPGHQIGYPSLLHNSAESGHGELAGQVSYEKSWPAA